MSVLLWNDYMVESKDSWSLVVVVDVQYIIDYRFSFKYHGV